MVFKYPCSVEDSIKFLPGTKLYGLPIVIKKYSADLEDPAYHDQLNYFKQLIDVERSAFKSNNGNTNRWNDQNSGSKTVLPEPPVSGKYNSNQDNYGLKSGSSGRPGSNNNSTGSEYQRGNSYTKGRKLNYDSDDRRSEPHYSRQKIEHNNSLRPMSVNDRDSYRKHRGNSSQTSSSRNESNERQRERSDMNENNSVKDRSVYALPRKCSFSDSVRPNDTNRNAAGTSLLDLQNTMYHCKSNEYKDIDLRYSNFKSHNSTRNNDTRGGSSFIHKQFGTSYSSESDRYHGQSYSPDKSYNSFQEYDNRYSNNSNEKNKSNNYKYKQASNQNLPTSSRERITFYPYKPNDEGHERREYKNTYNEQSGLGRGRSYNKQF